LFSKFATGEISSEQLKKDWAKKTLEKDNPKSTGRGNWVVVDNNTGKTVPNWDFEDYTEAEVRAKAKHQLSPGGSDRDFDMAYSIHPKETGRWEIYRDDHGQDETLEIIDADRRGEAVDKAYDIYSGVIPFKVRAYYGDETEKPKPTPRASLARQIVQQPAEEVKNWIVYDTVTGEEQYNQPGRKSNLVQAMRKMEQDNKWPRGRLALKLSDNQDIPPQEKEVEPNVAQNFTQQSGEQEVDGTGEPIWQIYQVSNGLVMSEITAQDAQEAAQALQDQLDSWATDDDVRELYAVRPKMAETRPADWRGDLERHVQDATNQEQNPFERNSDRIDAIRGRTPDASETPRNWEFVDRRTGRVVDTMQNASYNHANIWQAAIERSNPDADISLRSVERPN
jgi:hypothetical protein